MQLSKHLIINSPGVKRDFAYLLSGNIIVQIIAVLSYPVLTRLFNPEHFGELSLFVSISTLLVACIPARYDLAAVLTNNFSRVKNLLKISWSVLVFYTMIMGVLLIIGSGIWKYFIPYQILPVKIQYILFLPILVFFIGSYQIFESYLNSVRDFKKISSVKVVNRTVNSGVSVLLGFLCLDNINGLIGGFFVCNLVVFSIIIRKLRKIIDIKRDEKYIERIKKNYKDFAWFSMPNKIITMFTAQLPIYFIALFFGNEELGYYTLAYSILAIPEGIITTSLSPIFYKTVAERFETKRQVTPVIFETWLLVFAIGIVPAILIYFLGHHIFQTAFGADWGRAGQFASIIAPFLLLSSMGTASGSALTVFRKQHIAFVFSIIKLTIRPLALYVGYLSGSITFALQLFVLVNIIQIIAFNGYMAWYSKWRVDRQIIEVN